MPGLPVRVWVLSGAVILVAALAAAAVLVMSIRPPRELTPEEHRQLEQAKKDYAESLARQEALERRLARKPCRAQAILVLDGGETCTCPCDGGPCVCP